MTAKLGYYPGCSLKGSGKEYEHSLLAVMKALSIELEEVPGWLCCGATSAHAIDHTLATALAGDTLVKARTAKMDQVLAPCAMCYSRLATVSNKINHDPNALERLESALEAKDAGIEKVEPLSIIDWLRNMPDAELKAPLKRPLEGIKAACYYGCLLLRPQKITKAPNAEIGTDLERVVELLGGQSVKWNMSTACCGAGFSLGDKPSVLRMSKKIVDDAFNAGANVIITACPMCHSNLDMRQPEFKPTNGPMPILFISQLMGVAYNLDENSLGLGGHFIAPHSLLAGISAAKG